MIKVQGRAVGTDAFLPTARFILKGFRASKNDDELGVVPKG